jgi:hypothetical protein
MKIFGALNDNIVEALQFYSNSQSHWSSGSTVCFPSRGQRFVSQGCTNSQWNRFLLLVLSYPLSRYLLIHIGDPDVIDHWTHPRLCADNGKLH